MQPAFRIRADGQDATRAIEDRLLALDLTDSAGLDGDELLIRLDDRDALIELPATGARLALDLGFADELVEMGSFTVSGLALEGPARALEIKAISADLTTDLRAPRTAAWDNATLGSIVDSLAARHGLAPVVDDGLRAHAYAHLPQTAESDLHLVSRIASDLGAIAKVAAGRLIVTRAGRGFFPDGRPIPPRALAAREISSWRWRQGDRSLYSGVKAWWHDQLAGARKQVMAGDGAVLFELRRTWPSEEAARRAAVGKLAELKRARRAFSAELPRARLDLAAELPIDLSGARAGVDGVWVLTRVSHRLANGGLTTSIEAEPPDAGDGR